MAEIEVMTDTAAFALSAAEYYKLRKVCGGLPVCSRVYIPFSGVVFKMAFGFAPIDVTLLSVWQESVRFCFAYAVGWRGICPLARECGRKCREMLEMSPLREICAMLDTRPYGLSVVVCSLAKLWRDSDRFRARVQGEFNPLTPPTPAMYLFVQCCNGFITGESQYYRNMEYIAPTEFWG